MSKTNKEKKDWEYLLHLQSNTSLKVTILRINLKNNVCNNSYQLLSY